MILHNGLERYKDEIPKHYYKKYNKSIGVTRGKHWYGDKITLEAAAMVFCGIELKNDCDAYDSQIQSRRDAGEVISKETYVQGLEAVAEKYLKSARTFVNKCGPLLNPSFEGFFLKCSELYSYTSKRKKEYPNQVVLTINHARLFTGFTTMDANLRKHLMEVHCKSELHKSHYHPDSNNDAPIKQWLQK